MKKDLAEASDNDSVMSQDCERDTALSSYYVSEKGDSYGSIERQAAEKA